MGFFDNVQDKIRGAGAPRQPQPPGPGLTPMPATPRTTVPPPSPAARPVGRPPSPSPSFPGGVGAPLPLTASSASPSPTPASPGPSGPTPATPNPTPGPTPANPTTTQPGQPTGQPTATPTPAPAGGANPPQNAAMPGAVPGQGYSIALDHVPSGGETAGVPPNVMIQTPFGTVDRQTGALMLSPEGKQAYQEAIVRKRTEFGPHPWANDATASPIPITLGKPLFNPWTGQWRDRPSGWGGAARDVIRGVGRPR